MCQRDQALVSHPTAQKSVTVGSGPTVTLTGPLAYMRIGTGRCGIAVENAISVFV